MPATLFQITDGRLYLSVVNTGASGYLSSWQAPGGKTADTAALADYDTGATTWSCQVTTAALEATANTNDVTTPATFCQASVTTPQPGQTSYSLNGEFLQDPDIEMGLSRFLFEHDTQEAYFYLGLNVEAPPTAIGRVRLLAGSFGGPARENLTASLQLPLVRKPDIQFGTSGAGNSTIVKGDGTVVVLALQAEPEAEAEPEPESEPALV